jgi:acetyl-CoA carboxylase biotin carboxyl carrier protein
MNVKEIRELADLVARRGLASLELEQSGFRLRIEGPRQVPREAASVAGPAYSAMPVSWEERAPRSEASPAGAPAVPPAAPPVPEVEAGLHVVTSPIVGTFYRASNPDSEPFVKAGDSVEKGETLCIVEAMKLMNEIEADAAGTIVEIYPKNGQPVEFGEKLFAIRPA